MAVVTLNRPCHMNALNSDMLRELDLVLDTVSDEESIRSVIITGGEKIFAAGADIKQIINIASPVGALAFSMRAQSVISKIERLHKPVIADVAGLAFGGGCESALACDIRVAAENAIVNVINKWTFSQFFGYNPSERKSDKSLSEG